jgi:hypothetical protein
MKFFIIISFQKPIKSLILGNTQNQGFANRHSLALEMDILPDWLYLIKWVNGNEIPDFL